MVFIAEIAETAKFEIYRKKKSILPENYVNFYLLTLESISKINLSEYKSSIADQSSLCEGSCFTKRLL